MPSASAAWRAAISKRADFARVGAELRRQAELGMVRADADADEQVEVGRGDAVGRGRADDLVELLERVEAEGPHAMLEIGFGDRFLGLHRVHEAQDRLGQRLADQPDLADRGDVVMGDARVPQDPQQVGRGVRLDRIERAAGELLDEEAGSAPRGMRTQQASPAEPDAAWRCRHPPGCRSGRSLAPARDDACATQGTSNRLRSTQSCLAVGSPMGQRSAIYVRGSPM